ncbi:MAG: S8 family serine peptidase [Phycisphaerales bacterium]
MKQTVLALVAGLVLAPSFALAVDSDWRSDWRASRNKLIETTPDLKFDPSSIIVRFQADADPVLVEAVKLAAGLQFEPIETWSILPGVEHVRVVDGDATAALEKLAGMPAVVYAEYDYIVRTSVLPNDPSFGVLWGMNNTGQTVNGDPGIANADINAPEAWNLTTGSATTVIADIDSGVNYNHPDLAANSWINPGEIAGNGIDDDANGRIDDTRGWDFFSNDNNPIDDNGHGTHTAGTFGGVGNNGVGVTGVSWQCKIMALKFLGASGSGATTGAISAVQYLTQKGVKVSNNSWGGGGYSQALFDAISASRSVGHVFVAAAGNAGVNIDSSPSYPASYNLDNIISVAASDNNNNRASFSNYGRTGVDLAAPGVNIYSSYLSSYAYLDGTSMATPHVTGVVALVQGLHPDWTYTQVRDRILFTVRPVAAFATTTVTGGVLDAFAAVNDGAPANNAPTVSISSPTTGSTFANGATITFTGAANDIEDGALTNSLSWSSNLQGIIGTGGTFSRTLNAGTHTITASVTDTGGRTGTFVVTLTVQPLTITNDSCAGAINLPNGIAINGNNVGANTDGASSCGGTADMWYRYTTTGTSTLTFDTCGSATDTIITIYTGSCGAFTEVACNDDAATGSCAGSLASSVSFTPTANTTYYMRVAGFNGAAGSFTARASGGIATGTVPAAPTGITASRSGSTVTVVWTDASANETGFRVQRQQRVGNTWTNTATYTLGANVNNFVQTVSSGIWRWRVQSYNAVGSSQWTTYVQQTVP